MKRVIILTLLFTPGLLLAREPRLLFLPIENKSTENFAYVSTTVTDDLRTRLNERFLFKEVPDEDVKDIAEANHFVYPDEFHTKTVALQLGILLRSDITLSGSYRVSNQAGKQMLFFEIYLHSVQDKKMVSQIEFATNADDTIFQKVKVLSDKVIAEAAKILPNKGGGGRQYSNISQKFDSSLVLFSGTTIGLSPSETETIVSGDLAFQPTDFPLLPRIDLEYRRNNVYQGLDWTAGTSLTFGSADKNLVNNSNLTQVSLSAFVFNTGPGYKYILHPMVYVYGQFGIGYYFGKATIDTSLSGKVVTDENTGNTINEQTIDFFAPMLRLSFQFGIPITETLAGEIGSGYRLYFGEGTSHEILFRGGLVLGF